MKNNETKEFIAYEYLSMNVKSDKELLYIDSYENFGWILTNNTALIDNEDYYINNINTNGNKLVNIKFKRDRKIKNKQQLISLQRKLETALKEIEKLESKPYTKGISYSMTIGVIGTIFLAILVFLLRSTNPLYILAIPCGIIGIIGWILPFFIYIKVKEKTINENVTLIDEQYNIIYDTCEQARKLSS